MLSRVLILAALSLAIAAPLRAETLLDGGERRAPSSDRAVRPALPDNRAKTLDEAYKALAAAKSPMEAHGPEQRILAALNRSGSDTVDLLMGWANDAFTEKNYPEALDLIDQVVALKPDFAEAYNRRATIYYALDDYKHSLADIRTTLALEPRHFGALTGLAAILTEMDQRDRAIEVYRRILAIHPTMESARTGLKKLEDEAVGSPT